MATSVIEERTRTVEDLQHEAWAVCNASFAVSNRHVYLDLGQEIYRQATHERIQALFARGDAQNAELDQAMRART